MVDALQGRPGIFSARFSGPDATDASNNELLLSELQRVPLGKRGAQYVCHITLSDPNGSVRCDTEASCRGQIAMAPRGSAGFGYDPLFEVVEYHRTFGELGDTVKSMISHRGRAVRQMLSQIVALAQSGQWA